MIRKLSVQELIEAAKTLRPAEKALLAAAISDAPPGSEPVSEKEWSAVASEGLARAYGDSEPEYSDEDLLP